MSRHLICAGAALGAMLAVSLPAQAETLKLLVSWGPANKVAYMPADRFQKNLAKMSKDLKLTISGPETVKPFQQMAPLSSGVFDILYSHPAYHSKGLAVVTNAMKPDMDKMRSSGVYGVIDKFYQDNHNMKVLALVPVGTHGYHCYLRKPLSAAGDWKGRKIRGVSTYVGVIKELGGTAVSTTMPEVYSSLDKGVIDGACAPVNVFRATKHFEVAKFRTEPTFGQLVSMVGINLDRWKKLSPAHQKTLIEVGKATERDSMRIGDAELATDNAEIAKSGVKVTKFPAKTMARIRSVYNTSVWALADKCCGDVGKKLRAMAKKAQLTD